jgi:hypothetical protein
MSKPRRPPDTNTVSKSRALSSMTVVSVLFSPTGLMRRGHIGPRSASRLGHDRLLRPHGRGQRLSQRAGDRHDADDERPSASASRV